MSHVSIYETKITPGEISASKIILKISDYYRNLSI